MRPISRQHAHARRAQSRRHVRLSLLISCGILGAGAALLSLGTIQGRMETPGFTGFLVAAQAQEVREAQPAPPVPIPLLQPPLVEVSPPMVAVSAYHPEIPELPEPELPPMQYIPDDIDDTPLPEPSPRPVSKQRAPRATVSAPAGAVAAHAAEGEYTPPAYLKTPKPPYPASMRQSRIEGSVKLRVTLDQLGNPQAVEVLVGSGHAEFDTTARHWVLEHWLFKPARRGEQPVPGTVITSVHFVLN